MPLRVLEQHLQALGAVGPQERQLYADISRRSVRLALESGRIRAEQAQVMDRLLGPSDLDGPGSR
mgnify:CR=1 FL=1